MCLNHENLKFSKVIKAYLKIVLVIMTIMLNSCSIKLGDFNPTGDTKIVISGMISDSTDNHKIVVSRTKGVIETGFPNSVSNAIVVVTDNISLTDTFQYVPNVLFPISSYYKPSKSWAAVGGRTYSLTVIADGKTYTATDKMPNVSNYGIDSVKVTYRFKATPLKDVDTISLFQYNQVGFLVPYIEKDDSLFRVKIFAPNIKNGRANTKISIYREANGVVWPYNSQSVYVYNSLEFQLNDLYVLPPQQGPPTSIYFKPGDKCTLVLQSISDNAYSYFSGVNAVNSSDGGLFSAPAGNPENNLSGGALGYFYAAQVVTKTFAIKFIPGVTQTDNP